MSERKYVLREKKIDPFTVNRSRVLLTPDRCDQCGWSIVEQNRLDPWETLDETTQKRLLRAMEEHKKIAHPKSNRRILSEAEMPTEWLGQGGDTETQSAAMPVYRPQPRLYTDQ